MLGLQRAEPKVVASPVTFWGLADTDGVRIVCSAESEPMLTFRFRLRATVLDTWRPATR